LLLVRSRDEDVDTYAEAMRFVARWPDRDRSDAGRHEPRSELDHARDDQVDVSRRPVTIAGRNAHVPLE
jgi:hypothetical protein